MIKFEKTEVTGWEHAIRGMRNPKNSWGKSDSEQNSVEHINRCSTCPHLLICGNADKCATCANASRCGLDGVTYIPGPNDMSLMKTLRNAGTDHRKFMRMIVVYVDITAPLYWWKEFDTYKVGTVANSCSTMHKIADKRFEREDFSIEHIHNMKEEHWMVCMDNVIASLNVARERYLETKNKEYWWQLIQLLPSSYNQRRTVMLNYEVLANIYKSRKNHKLDEWSVGFINWIKTLPYSELITGEE